MTITLLVINTVGLAALLLKAFQPARPVKINESEYEEITISSDTEGLA